MCQASCREEGAAFTVGHPTPRECKPGCSAEPSSQRGLEQAGGRGRKMQVRAREMSAGLQDALVRSQKIRRGAAMERKGQSVQKDRSDVCAFNTAGT